jgi:ABC-2 type transport system ATP-binding protein
VTLPAPAAGAPAIEARGLVRRFGRVEALRGLTFEVRAGELYGLVGPDGAGKTTAIRVLAGLLDADGGEARVLGEDPARAGAAAREAIGLMPQQFSLYRDLTVGENLAFFARLHGVRGAAFRERSARLLALARLEPFVERRAGALSGGMYKKLALACALLHDPAVLLLDEPTNGVDPVSRRELWALLHELVHGGTAVLVSTPYMDEPERCDRVGIVHEGRLLAEGAPDALLAEGGHRGFEELFLARFPEDA